MDAREQFETTYYYFYQALKLLAQAPIEQCKGQGSYNTAWELKDDVSRGAAQIVNGVTSERLTGEQRQALLRLLTELEAVPAAELPAGVEFKDNLAAMSHHTWKPVRRTAKRLLLLLQPLTVSNDKYFAVCASKPFALTRSEVASYLKYLLRSTLLRQDWERFLRTPLPGSPDMDAVRLRCVRIEQFGGTGSDESISLTLGARQEIEQLLREINAEF